MHLKLQVVSVTMLIFLTPRYILIFHAQVLIHIIGFHFFHRSLFLNRSVNQTKSVPTDSNQNSEFYAVDFRPCTILELSFWIFLTMLSGFISIADFTLLTLNVDDQLESIFLEIFFITQKYRSELLLLNNLPITIWILIGQFLQLLMNFHLFDDIFVMKQCCTSRNSQNQFDHWKYQAYENRLKWRCHYVVTNDRTLIFSAL